MEPKGQQGNSVPLVATNGSLPLGGSSTFLLNLSKAFNRLGHRLPIVVLTNRIDHKLDFDSANVEVNGIDSKQYIYEDRLAWGYKQVANYRPKAVLACLSAESFEILRMVPKGVLRYGIIQSDDPGPYALVREFVPWLDGLIGVSKPICNRLKADPETRHLRTEYIPYGIDFPAAVARPHRRADDPLRVIYLGRLIEIQKRISRLAALIQQLDGLKANIHFTIVGSGPEEQTFRAAIDGCKNVRTEKAIPNHMVPDLLNQQDVYILLSDFEGLPLSLLEAMGQGVVPVVSDLESGLREVVTADCGFRVGVGDVNAAGKALLHLTADRDLLSKLSGAATKRSRESFNAEQMARRFLHLIESHSEGLSEPVWPAEVEVPVPRMLSPRWMYRGWGRVARRLIRRVK
jgi:glycosyltransferase involved in cell wall biosynthesis